MSGESGSRLLYALLTPPVLLVDVASHTFAALGQGSANFAVWLVAPLLLMSPFWTMGMWYIFQRREQWETLGQMRVAWLMTRAAWPAWVLPALAFWGLQALGSPLYGVAFFLGFLVLGAYYTRLFLELVPRVAGRSARG
jgi:hypothetical protein